MISAIGDLVAASPVPVVFDHFGGAQARLGVEQPGFADLLDLVRSGSAYVKISGAYRASSLAPDHVDVVPLARALIAANPDRVVWGTDWPHPDSATPTGGQAHRRQPADPDRRRPSAESAGRLGSRSCGESEDPGGQSGAPLRVLARRSGTPRRGLAAGRRADALRAIRGPGAPRPRSGRRRAG